MAKADPGFAETPPGHRFGLYFQVWNGQSWQKACKGEALRQTLNLPDEAVKQLEALRTRQSALISTLPEESRLSLDATSTSPFATGLGMEHPLENGFAFLNPYGLAYLPGSSIKGVLRQAARELAQGLWDDTQGWSEELHYSIEVGGGKDRPTVRLSMLDVLFGREAPSGDSDHVRGALSFWDVIPQIAGDSLMVEIMTPHQSHYYQQKAVAGSTTPHDSGQPIPISFLAVPPGSQFTFHAVCDLRHLRRLTADRADGAPDLLADGATHWKKLLEAAFEHAFAWLGFGAKTAVGYGAMMRREGDAGEAENAGTESASGGSEDLWPQAMLTLDPGSGEITASFRGQKTAPLRGDKAQALQLTEEQRQRLKKKKTLADVAVRVRRQGNLIELLGLAP